MTIHSLISTSVLLAALAACSGVAALAGDPLREEAAMRAAEGHWLVDAQTPGLERAFRALARE